jgi:hypothetical protein
LKGELSRVNPFFQSIRHVWNLPVFFFIAVQGIEHRMAADDDAPAPPTDVPHDHIHMHGDVVHSHPHDHPHDHHHDHHHDHQHLPLDTPLEEKNILPEPATDPPTDGIQFLGASG